ncbi:MAG TPA: SET domain-containing protein [Pirellulales bacterium]|nr:SET domain-containing protein [Pirellulales bacterium]
MPGKFKDEGVRNPKTTKPGRIRVGRSRVGRGVFAERWFAQYEVIGEVHGEVIEDREHESRYCMDLGDHRSLEPITPFRYMNHSCEPNCELHWFDVEGVRGGRQRRLYVIAIARIADGSELTIDYGWPAAWAIPCRCGAEDCRRWIVAAAELDRVETSTERASTNGDG